MTGALRIRGRFSADTGTVERSGLCTYQYARAVDLPMPLLFFTYQVLNVAGDTQVLLCEVLGPLGLPMQRTVYVRHRDGEAGVHARGFRHTVTEHASEPLRTPSGSTGADAEVGSLCTNDGPLHGGCGG